jgi:Insect cuticle protein
LALAAAQQGYYNRDPKTAAILSEQRYQQGDGKFGAAYTQEDGTDFKEETDADGTRRGSYSYIDPSGAKKTVSYTAGKHG